MKLKASIAQMNVAVSEPEANLQKAEGFVAEAARRGSELICFPEMWTTGFNWTNNQRMASEHEGVVERVAEMARLHGMWINGSMPTLDEAGRISNTSILFDPEGRRVGAYRKAHLFSFFQEDRHMAAGQALCVVDTPWGRAGLAICYDLRFPEMFRTYALKGTRFVLLPAAFPHPRLDHWKILLRARAIENQMFIIAANQVGREDIPSEGGVIYFGDSMIVDPWGRTVIEGGETDEMLLTAEVELDQVEEIRERMRVLADRRPELYELG